MDPPLRLKTLFTQKRLRLAAFAFQLLSLSLSLSAPLFSFSFFHVAPVKCRTRALISFQFFPLVPGSFYPDRELESTGRVRPESHSIRISVNLELLPSFFAPFRRGPSFAAAPSSSGNERVLRMASFIRACVCVCVFSRAELFT